MPQSHSTEAAESAPSRESSAVLEEAPELPLETLTVPDSPASLWMSVSKYRIAVEPADGVPAAQRDWVAPAVVVRTTF